MLACHSYSAFSGCEEKNSIDNARDDSGGVIEVLKPSKANDVAFIDTSMPRVNGSEAVNELRQHEAGSVATDNGDYECRPSNDTIQP